MKILSPVGILRIVCTLFGIGAIVVGVISAVYCRSFGIYRRGFMDRNHLRTEPEPPKDKPLSARQDFMRPYPREEKDPPTSKKGYGAHPWENGNWDQHSFTLLMVYFIVVPLAFAISTSLFGFQIGKPERESCKKAVDLGLHAVCFFFAIVGGLCLIAAAVVPDMVKRNDNKWDAKFDVQLVLGSRGIPKKAINITLESFIEHMQTHLPDVDGEDFAKAVQEIAAKVVKKHAKVFKDENGNERYPDDFEMNTIWQDIGTQLYDHKGKNRDGDSVKYSDELLKIYRRHNNFDLRLTAGSINLLYGILLLVLTIMIGVGMRKPKPKVKPIVELTPVVEAPPPPPPEEPVEGAEGVGGDDSISLAPVASVTAPPPPEAKPADTTKPVSEPPPAATTATTKP